jgi:hypothetical protein
VRVGSGHDYRQVSDLVGPVAISVTDGAAHARGDYWSLGITLSAPKTSLKKGEQVDVALNVTGLAGIREDAPLFLQKTGVVSMQGGDAQSLRISPADAATGTYTTRRRLTGLAVGAFNIKATVIDPRIGPRVVPLDQDAKVNGFTSKRVGGTIELQLLNVVDTLTGRPIPGDVRLETRCTLDRIPVLSHLFTGAVVTKTKTDCLLLIQPRILIEPQ